MVSSHIALVTGATSSIGKAIAYRLANEGYSVIVHYYKKKEIAENIAKQIDGKSVYADLTIPEDIENLIQIAGKIDILINNAAYRGNAAQLEDITLEDWESVFKVNINGIFLLTRAIIPAMKKQNWGRIVNITSVVADTGEAYLIPYAASKGALLTFTKSLAKELGAFNITVNAIAPGPIITDDKNLPISFRKAREKYHKNKLPLIPLGRIGKPEDIAYWVSCLVNEEANYITGQEIHINGGLF